MSKRIAAKHKIDRRLGQNIWGRPKSPVNHREYGPGQHGQRRKGKLSDFGVQLRAKQKLKGYYANISERQFKNIYYEAIRRAGSLNREKLRRVISKMDVNTVYGRFRVDREGIQTGHKMLLTQWQDGKRVIVWPEELASVQPRFPTPPWNQRP